MGEMAKFPYLSGRKGSKNLYYKRMVPLELRGAGRPAQIWRSLKTADRKQAERASPPRMPKWNCSMRSGARKSAAAVIKPQPLLLAFRTTTHR